MNGYYTPRHYTQDELQRLQDESNSQDMMGIMGAQSLDDIVNQNAKEFRRGSMPLPYGSNPAGLDSSMRRVSMMNMNEMMEFAGSSPTGPLNTFQFDPSPAGSLGHLAAEETVGSSGRMQSGRTSNSDLSINTQFPAQATYDPSGASGGVYPSPMQTGNALEMDMQSPYITSAIPSGIPMSLDMSMQNTDLFGPSPFHNSPMMESPIHQSFPSAVLAPGQDPGGGSMDMTGQLRRGSADSAAAGILTNNTSRHNSLENSVRSNSLTMNDASAQSASMPPPSTMPSFASPKRVPQNTGPPETINGAVLPWASPPGETHFKQYSQ